MEVDFCFVKSVGKRDDVFEEGRRMAAKLGTNVWSGMEQRKPSKDKKDAVVEWSRFGGINGCASKPCIGFNSRTRSKVSVIPLETSSACSGIGWADLANTAQARCIQR
jgi:hypothetical protein